MSHALTPDRFDDDAALVAGSLVATALLSVRVSTSMSPTRFRRSLRDFAATLIDANQVVGILARGSYRTYGPVLDLPGVAAIIDGSTVFELCELAARNERDRTETIRAERSSGDRVARGFARKAFTVRVQAHSAAKRLVRSTCPRPQTRPRQYRPRRVRVARTSGSRGDPPQPGDDEPPEVTAVALTGVAA